MLDFLMISTKKIKKEGTIEIFPKFIAKASSDLMIRGGDFYAIWIEDKSLWSTDEQDAIQLIDRELKNFAKEYKNKTDFDVHVLYLWDTDSGMIDKWHRYCKQQMWDQYHALDEKLIFSNTKTVKEDYASKVLPYPLESGPIPAYDKLISTLYSEEERHKIEWAIGSVISGDSKNIQKFMVFYGSAGTGKSTILNIIQQLFEGYYSVFDAKALGSTSNSFALEAFKTNPLVAIQHDGDLSKIEDNTRLNSLVSHELMTVNEKFKATYSSRFNAFLFMGTNKPVRITDAKSGLIRRLIDVTPSGNKLNPKEYKHILKEIDFEIGAIAKHCLDVYEADPGKYDNYVPLSMIGATNDFFNFVEDNYTDFSKGEGITLSAAWDLYKRYCEDARVPYPYSKRLFKEELRNYFEEFELRHTLDDGTRVRNYYKGFLTNKFEVITITNTNIKENSERPSKFIFKGQPSAFDIIAADYPAQYASQDDNGAPRRKWVNVKTTLKNINTNKLHYVKVPENHIVIDFDIKDRNGNKCFEKNLEAIEKWPLTYAELSKSGGGIHLHYIYTGDVSKLSRVYDDQIEIKIFTGNSSLRRKLTKCNDQPIASISSGLPLKEESKMVNYETVQSEKGLRTLIKRNMNKEIHPGTKPSVDFIHKILEDAYESGLKFDVTDMRNDVYAFGLGSTHQSDYCIKLIGNTHFKSEDYSEGDADGELPLAFFDTEIFPNLFLLNWKLPGEDSQKFRLINPSPEEVEKVITSFRLIGFNCRNYDNHMLYARMMGYSIEQLFDLSQKIIVDKDRNAKFGEAYNISYTDVYDFCSKKQSLKKWEIELGIHHMELKYRWDKPVPKEVWHEVSEYCDNDVVATEAVWNARQADFAAREIQVAIVKELHGVNASVNDTTNTLSQKIVFGSDRNPQHEFNWRDMSKPVGGDQYEEYRRRFGDEYVFRVFDEEGLPLYRDYIPGEKLPEGYSILPFFKDYKFEYGVSTYLDQKIGEGGRVYSQPGIWGNVWDGDISSQHPHSAIMEVILGPKYTKIFQEIVDARVAIKHKDFETASGLLGGVLTPYLTDELAKGLAQALKIVINSIYGLTSAKFVNAFRDPNNVDNIVAKRGALFMTLLKQEVEKRGFIVCHIKTDSIKIPDANDEIKDFVIKFGREFGYEFETEAVFEKFCLVNDAVYVGKHKDDELDGQWSATGTQFQVPYVFKTMFTKEPINFDDLCETKSVGKGTIYLDMNEGFENVADYELALKVDKKIMSSYGSKNKESFEEVYNSLTDKEKKLEHMMSSREGRKELKESVSDEHDYHFVGRVGQFCPIKPGKGGGVLYRVDNDKYYAVTGTKGYRWLESEVIRGAHREEDIDRSYYESLVNDAIETISFLGDYEWFVSDDPYVSPPFKDGKPYYLDLGQPGQANENLN